MSTTLFAVPFDAHEAKAIATFWAEALGRTVADGATEASATVAPDPAAPGLPIGFRQVPEDKTVKNRMHFDLVAGNFDAEVTRLNGLARPGVPAGQLRRHDPHRFDRQHHHAWPVTSFVDRQPFGCLN